MSMIVNGQTPLKLLPVRRVEQGYRDEKLYSDAIEYFHCETEADLAISSISNISITLPGRGEKLINFFLMEEGDLGLPTATTVSDFIAAIVNMQHVKGEYAGLVFDEEDSWIVAPVDVTPAEIILAFVKECWGDEAFNYVVGL